MNALFKIPLPYSEEFCKRSNMIALPDNDKRSLTESEFDCESYFEFRKGFVLRAGFVGVELQVHYMQYRSKFHTNRHQGENKSPEEFWVFTYATSSLMSQNSISFTEA
ncbi:hypothetical protein GQX74_008760 [Glossina fuscipes]|nr:hypothetical protein GQX74_008760 [Glossina fuscipes]